MKRSSFIFRFLARAARQAHRTRTRRTTPSVDGLETRNLMTAGSVVQSGALVTVTPAPTGSNVAIVSYATVQGVTMLDVNLNGTDHFFSLSQVGFVYYEGSASSGTQLFENNTSLHTVAWGGSGANVFVSGSNAADEFFGGSGANTFDAGTGVDEFFGGSGANTFNESATGSGLIFETDSNNTINEPSGASGSYNVL